jgi:hypothetical protein
VAYYQAHKPDPDFLMRLNMPDQMWEYPRSLFGWSSYGPFRYLAHGLLFWLFVPAAAITVYRGPSRVTRFFVASTVVIFAFFEFYPQYLEPRYVPLVRQDRYLEMLLPGAVIVVGMAFRTVARTSRRVAIAALAFVLALNVSQASRRWLLYDDSQRDVRALARYVRSTLVAAGKPLFVDVPARNALLFYLTGASASIDEIRSSDTLEISDAYIAVGGARSSWWSRELVFDLAPESVPSHWHLTYQENGKRLPWRPSNLRVYYVGGRAKASYPLFDTAQPRPSGDLEPGFWQTLYRNGFDGPFEAAGAVSRIPDIDNGLPLPAAHLAWDSWLRAEDDLYTFESISDDGSWVYLNGKLALDNGGTHPARLARRTVRLAPGWYRVRILYEDTGGDQFLRFRVNSEPSMHGERFLRDIKPRP